MDRVAFEDVIFGGDELHLRMLRRHCVQLGQRHFRGHIQQGPVAAVLQPAGHHHRQSGGGGHGEELFQRRFRPIVTVIPRQQPDRLETETLHALSEIAFPIRVDGIHRADSDIIRTAEFAQRGVKLAIAFMRIPVAGAVDIAHRPAPDADGGVHLRQFGQSPERKPAEWKVTDGAVDVEALHDSDIPPADDPFEIAAINQSGLRGRQIGLGIFADGFGESVIAAEKHLARADGVDHLAHQSQIEVGTADVAVVIFTSGQPHLAQRPINVAAADMAMDEGRLRITPRRRRQHRGGGEIGLGSADGVGIAIGRVHQHRDAAFAAALQHRRHRRIVDPVLMVELDAEHAALPDAAVDFGQRLADIPRIDETEAADPRRIAHRFQNQVVGRPELRRVRRRFRNRQRQRHFPNPDAIHQRQHPVDPGGVKRLAGKPQMRMGVDRPERFIQSGCLHFHIHHHP
ncbi:hypothetical protein SDC9_95802 [bioreactor metagenome]|uniref:Uncharacterized protein n=1 Tax=bioreactor metagenome TaxID=1076179 RepID=A0A645AHE7_9ZZZZ